MDLSLDHYSIRIYLVNPSEFQTNKQAQILDFYPDSPIKVPTHRKRAFIVYFDNVTGSSGLEFSSV